MADRQIQRDCEPAVIPIVEIDEGSGFCFGVVNAIRSVEKELEKSKETLYCLGDIVHNSQEVERLEARGMRTISYQDLEQLRDAKVLLRAHGEPPSIYRMAERQHLKIVDATCPVVLALQRRIRRAYDSTREICAQIVIFGQRGHAEVNGLVGQCEGDALVIENPQEIESIDRERPVLLFSQTTKGLEDYAQIIELIGQWLKPGVSFEHYDTICRQVSNRIPHIREFAAKHGLVLFVAGKKSSNGRVLFAHCQDSNPRSVFLSSPEELSIEQLMPIPRSIGICGATSTPKRQMEAMAEAVKEILACGS